MDLSLKGKKVAVTGASKGIGAGIAEVFAEEGCELHLIARSKDLLEQLAGKLAGAHGVKVSIHEVDLRNSGDVDRVAKAIGDVDVLVNNAGDIPGGTLDAVDEEKWRKGWDLKVYGYVNLTRAIYASMKASGGGVIVNNIGVAGERVMFDYIAGSAGNAALMAFTQALGSRSLDDNIRVVGVSPGPVETDRIVSLMKTKAAAQFGDESRYQELMAHWPLGRPAKIREIAETVVFMASPRSSYTSATIVAIDGGLSARGGF